jgi:hypothetical protein
LPENPDYKKITKASVRCQESPILLRIGGDKELEIRKEGDDYYLVEPEKADEGSLKDCRGAIPLLNGAHVVIGRQEISSECLDLPDSISRQHLLIKREFHMIYLFDLHSKNGTFLAG